MRQSRRTFLNLLNERLPPADAYWLHVNRTAMACRFEISLPTNESNGVAAAVDALNEIDRIEEQLTIFRDSSVISDVNRRAATTAVEVNEEVFALLSLCQELHSETEGVFDITSGPLTRCWGFLKHEGRIPSSEEIQRMRDLVGCDKLLLDREQRTVRFDRQGLEINLGSIGKGYALDRVAFLLTQRVGNALLNAGSSSFLAIGCGENRGGWVVGIRNPRSKQKRLAVLELRDCALSTSGSEEQFFERDGKRFGHIIDPRTGWPSSAVSSVSVVCDSSARSDALATAFFIGGPAVAERYCKQHENMLAIILERDSQVPIVIGNNKNCHVEILAQGVSR